jgi:hypothetical protein
MGLLAWLLGAARCQEEAAVRCRTSVECGTFRECNVQTGQCLCSDNRACGAGEFCNNARTCQPLAGCTDNTDCEQLDPALICDIKTGQCQDRGGCYQDSQCPLGNICELGLFRCVAGCRDEADCLLGSGCLRTPSDAPLGVCSVGSCSTNDQCGVGQFCDLTVNRCVRDDRGPFCGPCQRFDPLDPQCGNPANYCLIDTGDPTRRGHYCGVDCSQQQACPQGYTCAPVIIVGPPATPACALDECVGGRCTISGTSCTVAMDCPVGPPGGDCERARVGICAGTVDTECMGDMDCGGSEGACRKAQCRIRERAAYGFCSCVVDRDCPRDNCRGADLEDLQNPRAGHCFLSGHRCFVDDDCDVIACVNGGCRIGENCKPGMDRRCADLMGGGVTP